MSGLGIGGRTEIWRDDHVTDPQSEYDRIRGLFHGGVCNCYPCRYRRATKARESLVWPDLILTEADKKLLAEMKVTTDN